MRREEPGTLENLLNSEDGYATKPRLFHKTKTGVDMGLVSPSHHIPFLPARMRAIEQVSSCLPVFFCIGIMVGRRWNTCFIAMS